LLLKRLSGKNYFIASMILLGITIVLVITVFALTAFIPDALGQAPQEYTITSVCEFEPWHFRVENLSVNFPDGGIIATVQETNYDRSVMLLGKGTLRSNNTEYDQDSALGIFMTVEHELFDQIRGDNIFLPIEDRDRLEMVSAVFHEQVGKPTIWEGKIPISFHTPEGLSYFYFIAPDGEPILPPEAEYSQLNVLGSAAVYTLFVLIMLLVITLFTLDHRYSSYWVHLARTHPGYLGLGLVPLLSAVYAASTIMPELNDWPKYYAFFGYAAGILLLLLLFRGRSIDYLDFGLRRDRVKHGYPLAIIAAALVIMATRGLPGGIDLGGTETITQLPLLFLLIGLPREMIWRGYIQTYLSRLTGPNWGLLIMIALAAVSSLAFILATEPWMLDYPYTYLEIAVLTPGMAAILGYIYLRTENILACALLHSLVIFLPGITLY